MNLKRFLISIVLIGVVLFSQPAFSGSVLAQDALADAYAAKLALYAPDPPPPANTLRPADLENIRPLAQGQVGSHWDIFTFEVAGDNGSWDIYSYQDGASPELVPLATSPANDVMPRVSPQNDRVVFASKMDGADYELYSINPDGSGLKQLTNNTSDDVYPSFSPDGSQLAFQAYRDGQAEIYKMNIDGSKPVRLTRNANKDRDYDGMPAWSPDGTRIAFISNVARWYEYWVFTMDTNGQNIKPLPINGEKPWWSAHPAWSPDGKKIAFDAAYNYGSPQTVYLYDFDILFDKYHHSPLESNLPQDYEVESFMSGGRYLGITGIQYTEQNGSLVVSALKPYAVEMDPTDLYYGHPRPLILENVSPNIWGFDWRSLDPLPPVTTIQPLPPVSPAPIVLNWSGADPGGSGVAGYELQFKYMPENNYWNQQWDIQAGNSLTVQKINGAWPRSFRIRAIDAAGNREEWKDQNVWTTEVEKLPPKITFTPVPLFQPYDSIVFTWDGWDPGGSGVDQYNAPINFGPGCGEILSYYVLYEPRIKYYDGSPGNEYGLCLRAIDKAGNETGWITSPYKVKAYFAALSGTVFDNQGKPVRGAAVDLTATPMAVFPSDAIGKYLAYLPSGNNLLSTGWSKAGYGTPTRWQVPNMPGLSIKDVYLPPAVDLIANGSFEAPFSAADWTAAGDAPPTLATNLVFLGNGSAYLGGPSITTPASSSLSQTVTIPAGMRAPGLSFMYWLDPSPPLPDKTGVGKFEVKIIEGETTTPVYRGVVNGWTHAWVDLSAWKGKQVTLRFVSSAGAGEGFLNAALDEVSLGETYPDGWVSLDPAAARALPGQQIPVRLSYGARGLPLDQPSLALALPPELEWVSASQAPELDGTTLRWTLPPLSPAEEAQTIDLVLQVKAGVPGFKDLALTASLQDPAVDLEPENNTATSTIRTETVMYVPLAMK